MAYTTVPTVVDGDDLTEDFTIAVKAVIDELAAIVPQNHHVNLTRVVAQTHNSTGNFVTLAFNQEVIDTDGYHASSDGFVTIPSGLGGDYLVTAGIHFASNATGIRELRCTITNNATTTTEVAAFSVSAAAHATAGNKLSMSKELRLEAGAVVTMDAYQNSGGNMNIDQEFLTVRMVRPLPSLT